MRITLDRYVARITIGSWLATLLFFVLLSVLLDLLNHLGDYLESADKESLGLFGLASLLARYYVRLVPVFFVSVAPFVTVIACMFALARVLSANEVVPMLFAGRSMFRVLRPMLYTAALSGLCMAGCWQWVVPQVREKVADTASFLGGGGSASKGIVLAEDAGGSRKMLFISTYDRAKETMEGVVLLIQGATPGDVALVQARHAKWDRRAGDWRLEDGQIRHGAVTDLGREYLGEPSFLPDRVWKAGMENLEADLLSYADLLDIHRLRPNRLDVTLALHRHVTYPLANLIMLLLALPFAIHFDRGARIERTIGAIGVCGAYLLVDLICQSLGQRVDYLNPIVAAWLPTILFGSLGVAMFSGIRT